MSSTAEAPLASWRDTATTRAILEFVAAATREGDEGWIPPPERVAVFDNDGTLWCESCGGPRVGRRQRHLHAGRRGRRNGWAIHRHRPAVRLSDAPAIAGAVSREARIRIPRSFDRRSSIRQATDL
jgi:hypothetical protein